MRSDSQGQPRALLIKDQKFVSFFCHGHLFQLRFPAGCPSAAVCADKVSVSTVHRGRHLLHPALPVQEEECEAHRRCDAAGGPARYEGEAF